MRVWFFVLVFTTAFTMALVTPLPLLATQGAKKNKSKINTQLFEQEDESSSHSGKVKVIREIQGETEVFIDNPKGSSGPFVLPTNIKDRAALLSILHKSQKAGGRAVILKVDGQQRITSVDESKAPAAPEWEL